MEDLILTSFCHLCLGTARAKTAKQRSWSRHEGLDLVKVVSYGMEDKLVKTLLVWYGTVTPTACGNFARNDAGAEISTNLES